MNSMAKRNLILYMSGFSISSFGNGLQFISITWLLYELSGNATYTGLLVGLGFLPSLLLNLFFGVIVDRMNRKMLAMVSNITISVGVLIFLVMVSLSMIYVW